MAKRLTDTNKWVKRFIRNLPGAYKLLWFYMIDECDHAGIWIVDFEVAQIRVGKDMPISEMEALEIFNGKVIPFDDNEKWFIPSFIEFQYGTLNPENRVHKSAIDKLERYNLMGLTSPLQGDKYKYKDKDKLKDKETPKIKYADNVLMTEIEYNKLIDELGCNAVKWIIKKLNTYKGANGKKYKSDYMAINSWVIDEYKKQCPKKSFSEAG